MDFDSWIETLYKSNVCLRHHATIKNMKKIKEEGILAGYTELSAIYDQEDRDRVTPVPAVYFQLVKGVIPRYINGELNEVLYPPIQHDNSWMPPEMRKVIETLPNPFVFKENRKVNLEEMWVSPKILQGKQIIFHPERWYGGSTMEVKQWSTMKNLSNISLEEAHKSIMFGDEDEMNEVLILQDISKEELHEHLLR